MCRKVECTKCGKWTWTGCGKHIKQALEGIPKNQLCTCNGNSSMK